VTEPVDQSPGTTLRTRPARADAQGPDLPMNEHLIFQGRGVYKGEAGPAARSQSAGAGSVGPAVKKRVMSSAAVGDSIIAWTRADISAIG
jgi:hypothetical protein